MEVRPGYKMTEVGVIPEEWSVRRVRNLGTVITGGTPSTAIPDYWNGEHPWITPTDITDQRDMSESQRMISDAGLRAIRSLSANSVLVTCIASIGKNAILRRVGGCNQQINAVIPNESQSAEYLYYLFEAAKGYLLANAGTTATSIVSKAVFEQLTFAIPPLPEQRVIAAALSDVDALLDSLERLITKKRDLKRAAMQQLLTGQTRLPGFHGEWEVKRLGEIAQLKNGFSFQSSTYTPLGQFKVVTIANVQDGHMDASQCNMIAKLPRELQSHHRLQRGDILISMTGNVGRVCRVTEDDCLLNQRVGKLVPSGVEGDFLFAILRQRFFLAAMEGKAKGGAQGNLSKTDITAYPFLVPTSIPEQAAIAAVLSDMDAELAALEARSDKTRDLKQAMMQELLTGKTRLVPSGGAHA